MYAKDDNKDNNNNENRAQAAVKFMSEECNQNIPHNVKPILDCTINTSVSVPTNKNYNLFIASTDAKITDILCRIS